MARFELTHARIRYLIIGALIAALILIIGSNEAVRQPVLEKVKQPFQGTQEAPRPPAIAPPQAGPEADAGDVETAPQDHKAGKVTAPKPSPVPKPIPDQVDFMALTEANDFCKMRRLDPYPHRKQKRKVFDLIIVNRELEWLEIRLGQMAPYVDYFVILEADITFTDQSKPLMVKENMEHFKQYHHKMIRHTLNTTGQNFTSTWEREAFSRNAMVNQVLPFLSGEQKPEQDDVVIIADVDEIPRPGTLKALRNCEIPEAITLKSSMYYYSFQWLNRQDGQWPHPQAMLWKGPEMTREADNLRMSFNSIPAIYNAAWHCSYCFGSFAEMVNKVKSFSHAELDRPEFKDPKKILERVRFGMDFYDRSDSHFDRFDNNLDVPDYLLAHKDKYAFTLDRDPQNGNFIDYDEYMAMAEKEETAKKPE